MKMTSTKSLGTASAVLALLVLSGCTNSTYNAEKPTSSVNPAVQTNPVVASTLTQQQINDLKFIYEEEKLARDVYAVMYKKWNIQAFNNIGSTEQRHMDAVQQLADSVGILIDNNLPQGKFNDAKLQQAYNDLVAKGLQSPEQALKVGAYIEELDIDDLNKITTNDLPANFRQTYDWLNLGSRNHLRGFVQSMTNQSIQYQPQILSQSAYDAIINSPQEKGGMGQGNGGGRYQP